VKNGIHLGNLLGIQSMRRPQNGWWWCKHAFGTLGIRRGSQSGDSGNGVIQSPCRVQQSKLTLQTCTLMDAQQCGGGLVNSAATAAAKRSAAKCAAASFECTTGAAAAGATPRMAWIRHSSLSCCLSGGTIKSPRRRNHGETVSLRQPPTNMAAKALQPPKHGLLLVSLETKHDLGVLRRKKESGTCFTISTAHFSPCATTTTTNEQNQPIRILDGCFLRNTSLGAYI
jgi:hypothetical protein